MCKNSSFSVIAQPSVMLLHPPVSQKTLPKPSFTPCFSTRRPLRFHWGARQSRKIACSNQKSMSSLEPRPDVILAGRPAPHAKTKFFAKITLLLDELMLIASFLHQKHHYFASITAPHHKLLWSWSRRAPRAPGRRPPGLWPRTPSPPPRRS